MLQERLQRRFLELLKRSSSKGIWKLLELEKMLDVSYQMEKFPLQDPYLFRSRFLGAKVASLIIGDDGFFKMDLLEKLNIFFKKHKYPLGPGLQMDSLIFEHISICLDNLLKSPVLQ